jgi:hypothetical protein
LGGLGERVCLKCGNAITVDDLIGEHATPQSSDGNSFSKFAYCDKCEYTGTATVIPIGNGHVCLHCLCPHLGISQCAWCGEMVTGETGSYDSPGCVMCKHYIIDEAFNE